MVKENLTAYRRLFGKKANARKFSVPQVGQKYFPPGWGVNLKNEPLQGKLGLDQLEAEFLSNIAHISLHKYITRQIYHLTNISLNKYTTRQIYQPPNISLAK